MHMYDSTVMDFFLLCYTVLMSYNLTYGKAEKISVHSFAVNLLCDFRLILVFLDHLHLIRSWYS